MAGDAAILTIQRVIIDVDTGRMVRLQIPPDPHRSSACYDVQCGDGEFADVQWSPDGSHLAFVSSSRDPQAVAPSRAVADSATGTVRDVLDEQAATYYESDISSTSHAAVNWRYLPGSNEFIWISRSGTIGRIFICMTSEADLKHRITTGDWNVVEVLRVDEKKRELYFLGVGREKGRDPYFVHFYKIGFDAKGIRLLTPEDADHEITWRPPASTSSTATRSPICRR